MSKVALVVIYNHQYNKNIAVIEKLYENRFSEMYHLVPFYEGNNPNVIPVYENSFYFQGYISQGLSSFFNKKYEHYFFIGDDLILNPLINENNYKQHMKLDSSTSFIPNLSSLHKFKHFWGGTLLAYNYRIDTKGVEVKNIIPSYSKAISLFKKNNLEIKSLKYEQLYKKPSLTISIKDITKTLKYYTRKIIHKINMKKYNLSYPLISGYSDILVVSSEVINDFCTYAGVFSTTDLFVELALPKALVLSGDKVVTEKDLDLRGKALWSNEHFKILDKYDKELNKLLNDFPKNHLYIHPIKLSIWR